MPCCCLGVACQHCDLFNTVIFEHATRSVSRGMGICNDRHLSLPKPAWSWSNTSFLTSLHDIQVGISRNICRKSLQFFWCSVMGVNFHPQDTYHLIHTALQLDSVNNFICNSAHLTADEISNWIFLFKFCQLLVWNFKINVNTKIHRILRHISNQLVHLGCIFRGSSEENERMHKSFRDV